MKLLEVFELYNLISSGLADVTTRRQARSLRKEAFTSLTPNSGFKKLAFDTRRIDQENDYIPRRGLQNYHRSEKFISDAIGLKIESFTRLAKILEQLKIEYGREPEWQDSYTRVLGSAIKKGLRTDQADDDFSDAQPSMGSLDYLEQLMYVRYRLTPESMSSMSDDSLRQAILSKDELLVSQGISLDRPAQIITPSDVSNFSHDGMMDKMLSTLAQVMSSYKPPKTDDNLTNKLFDVKATKDAPEVERTVTITIKDKMINGLPEKTGQEPVVETQKIALEEPPAKPLTLDDLIAIER